MPVGMKPISVKLSPSTTKTPSAIISATKNTLPSGEIRMSWGIPPRDRFTEIGFIPTGIGTHGLTISRDGKKLYVANRGSHVVEDRPHGPGSVSVIDFATRRIIRKWSIPGGGSPDMGNVSADGKYLWLSGRFDDVVYRIDTRSGAVVSIPVGREPHGLTVWPQPGRYSLGHTGIMR